MDFEKCACPVCHSDKVHGFEEYDGYEWWSECVSGKDHGVYILPDGSRHAWPGRFWFSETGWLRTTNGKIKVHSQSYPDSEKAGSSDTSDVENITLE